MSRILFAWELGGNLGHVGQLLPVADILRSNGHEAVFVVRHLNQAVPFLESRGFGCIQAPLLAVKKTDVLAEPGSYPEILQQCGWGSVEELSALIQGWRELYRWIVPDAIVGSHAPTALLAARNGDARRIALGTGFECPPRTSPFPSLRSWAPLPLSRLLDSEEQVLSIANAAMKKYAPLARTFRDLLEYDEELLCTFPALDHYPGREHGEYCGALYSGLVGDAPRWPEGDGKRVFVYLRPQFAGFEQLIEIVAEHGVRALVFAPGVSRTVVEKYQTTRLVFSPGPLHMDKTAISCDLAIGHGGHGMTSAFLRHGVPLLLLPTQLEQYQTAWNVSQCGAGRMVKSGDGRRDIAAMLDALLNQSEAKRRAQSFQYRHGADAPERVAQTVASRVADLIGRE